VALSRAGEIRVERPDGVSLWAEWLGPDDDEPIILLAGSGIQGVVWEPCAWLPWLQAGRGVIRFDWRDVGLSDRVDFDTSPYGLETLVDDAAAVLEAFGVVAFHSVAWSMGGRIAQALATRDAASTRSLTLIGARGALDGDVRIADRSPALATAVDAPLPADHDGRLRWLLDVWRLSAGPRYPFDEAYWTPRLDSWIRRGHNFECPQFEMSFAAHPDVLARIFTPTLVIQGTDDAVVPAEDGEALAKAIEGADLVMLDGMGHELPPGLYAEIRDTLDAHVGIG
jgi:pimeloyl-ACP methyl ester carboxylesterase